MCRDCDLSIINPDSSEHTLCSLAAVFSWLSKAGQRIAHQNEGKARDHHKKKKKKERRAIFQESVPFSNILGHHTVLTMKYSP